MRRVQRTMKESDYPKQFLLDIFMPNRCPFCGRVIAWNRLSCEKCISEVEWYNTGDGCKRCAKKLCICDDDYCVDKVFTTCYYKGIVKNGTLNLKVNKGINLAEIYAIKLNSAMLENGYDFSAEIITAVPMNKHKKRINGYNHAEEIGRALSDRLNIPYSDKLLVRVSNDRAQHSLKSEDRRAAVIGLYELYKNADVAGKRIILCDDVYTTGSTVNECARILKEGGAESVIAAVGATTELEQKTGN